MYLAYNRGNLKDKIGMFLCIIGMSISPLFYIIIIQVIMGKWLKLLPISGFQYGIDSIPFIIMPILVALVASMGQEVRFYRTIFLEEIKKDYITTAQSKGISQKMILFIHVLKNAMIPILTGVVITIPFLFVGSLLLESFFAIPGLGSYLLSAIQKQDFAIVQAMVSLGSFLYIIGLLLTDISYMLIDPRINLK